MLATESADVLATVTKRSAPILDSAMLVNFLKGSGLVAFGLLATAAILYLISLWFERSPSPVVTSTEESSALKSATTPEPYDDTHDKTEILSAEAPPVATPAESVITETPQVEAIKTEESAGEESAPEETQVLTEPAPPEIEEEFVPPAPAEAPPPSPAAAATPPVEETPAVEAPAAEEPALESAEIEEEYIPPPPPPPPAPEPEPEPEPKAAPEVETEEGIFGDDKTEIIDRESLVARSQSTVDAASKEQNTPVMESAPEPTIKLDEEVESALSAEIDSTEEVPIFDLSQIDALMDEDTNEKAKPRNPENTPT